MAVFDFGLICGGLIQALLSSARIIDLLLSLLTTLSCPLPTATTSASISLTLKRARQPNVRCMSLLLIDRSTSSQSAGKTTADFLGLQWCAQCDAYFTFRNDLWQLGKIGTETDARWSADKRSVHVLWELLNVKALSLHKFDAKVLERLRQHLNSDMAYWLRGVRESEIDTVALKWTSKEWKENHWPWIWNEVKRS